MTTVTRNSLGVVLATVMLNAACGSTTTDPVVPACDICSISYFVCSHGGGLESVNFQIDSQSDDGCFGRIVRVSGPQDPPLHIVCEPPQLCHSDGTCSPGNFDHDTLLLGEYTCVAAKHPGP
jgi:hypothetical protein